MVPARRLLRRDAHGTKPLSRDAEVVTAPLPLPQSRHMAQEPIDQHQEPPPKPPPQQQERQGHAPEEERRREALVPPPPPPRLQSTGGGHQEACTSGSSSGGSSSNGGGGGGGGEHRRDWLRLGLGPASPGTTSSSDLDLFATMRPRPEAAAALPFIMPTGAAFLRPAMPGIPPASIPLHLPRAGPPWLPPWSPAALAEAPQPPPSLLPFAHHHRAFFAAPPGSPAAGAATPCFDMIRVLHHPPAAAAGVWFVLQAAPHQGREPFLPQIPRSYLRIKDGRVTVRLLMKYVVSKLGLEDESEVEVTCRGRPLPPFLTLLHVRDSIWCQRDAVSPSVVPDMSTANHIMVLQYGRRP